MTRQEKKKLEDTFDAIERKQKELKKGIQRLQLLVEKLTEQEGPRQK